MTDTLARLETVIASRKDGDPETSYVARLFAGGRPAIARKLGEEATETVIAALEADDAGFAHEAADLLFHLLILCAELERREGVSGLEEKAAR
jgi:phosphoribosyl-ATP pyrophosphohydrolase